MSKHPIDILKENGTIDKLAKDMSPGEVETAMQVSRKIIDTYMSAFLVIQEGFRDPKTREQLEQHFGKYGTHENMVEELLKEGVLVEDPEEVDDG